MSVVETEHVLVVPTAHFHELGYFEGFSADARRYLDALLNSDLLSYRPREQMELDPGFKQLIPYVIFRHTDQQGAVSLFQYVRGSGQGEQRLHRKQSIGVGGHICSHDAQSPSGGHAYHIGMQRELEEEVSIETAYRERCVGLINDDETEVGRVHLGVVHLVDVESPAVTPREADLAESGFVRLEELLADTSRFESWSRICLEALFR
ncbi:MAG: phosphoesterase [Pirellulaceae bacterium]|nr:phosphoesterase [Pirellulaceae bacterium]